MRESRGGADREREREREIEMRQRIPSKVHAASAEPDMGLEFMNHEVMT